jgi:hypothetical protein
VNGTQTYSRYILRPDGAKSTETLKSEYGLKGVVPLDCFLGIDQLPFKISVEMMLQIAWWAQNQPSYEDAENTINSVYRVRVNDDTIRSVTNYIGTLVFEEDCQCADYAYNIFQSGKLPYNQSKNGVLYIECDGAAINTRTRDLDNSTWRENKLGIVFNSGDMRTWTDKHGDRQHQILRRIYISCIGSVVEFKKHLLAAAIQGGYGEFKRAVLLSDGATWIRNMAEELFPDALHILDYFHLCENVHDFAKELFRHDETKYKPWAKQICDILRCGEYKIALEMIGKVRHKCKFNLYGYIENNIGHIDYAVYEKEGLFIGSGAIESGNKIILQRRLKQSGMRWNPATAQALLTLISKEKSGLWLTDVQNFIYNKFNLLT